MGNNYNPNRDKNGQFTTGPKKPANPANRELSTPNAPTPAPSPPSTWSDAEIQAAILRLVQEPRHDATRVQQQSEDAAQEEYHYRYRPVFQEEDICPTCTGNDMQNIVNWPCTYVEQGE